eukprot:Nitzschia sp. Nitz4//scaffold124_size66437//50334//51704//NITZ4_006118-RA/size66437-processed-gene-0.91-mRNA-1//1//CDS//3329534573//7987//frame0
MKPEDVPLHRMNSYISATGLEPGSSGASAMEYTETLRTLLERGQEEDQSFLLKPKTNSKNSLSWRSDPTTSFSDWKIEVVSVVDGTPEAAQVYHCHSNVLAWGPRKSSVFEKLFEERLNKRQQTSKTQIQLSQNLADAFPMLLDFMYCERSMPLSADLICNLYVLADRFDVDMLKHALQTFVERSLSFDQSVEFLSHARNHEHKEVIEKLVMFTNSKLCGYLAQSPEDAIKISPELLAHILQKRAQVIKVLKGEDPRKFSGEWELDRSRRISVVIAECCYHAVFVQPGSKRLSRETFEQLVASKYLPALAGRAALKILQINASLQDQKGGEDNSYSKEMRMTSLDSRCIKALVSEWISIHGGEDKAFLLSQLTMLESHVLAELLLQVSKLYEGKLSKAKREASKHEILEIVPGVSVKPKARRSDPPQDDHLTDTARYMATRRFAERRDDLELGNDY